MSSFLRKTKHPKTGKMRLAFWLDDYFAHRIYGVGFRKDGKNAKLGETEMDYEFFREEEINNK